MRERTLAWTATSLALIITIPGVGFQTCVTDYLTIEISFQFSLRGIGAPALTQWVSFAVLFSDVPDKHDKRGRPSQSFQSKHRSAHFDHYARNETHDKVLQFRCRVSAGVEWKWKTELVPNVLEYGLGVRRL